MGLELLKAVDWRKAAAAALADGYARLGPVLWPAERSLLMAAYDDPAPWRSTVDMERYAFGRGQYKYFGYPMTHPAAALVAEMRERMYAPLAPLATHWRALCGGKGPPFPAALADFVAAGRPLGQTKPTPLVLKYGPGDYNRLHQDVYGESTFPFQVITLLSDPADFEGGELCLTFTAPRQQARVEVVPLAGGEAVLVPVAHAPTGTGLVAAARHGVSRVRSGTRFTLGVVFHDAP